MLDHVVCFIKMVIPESLFITKWGWDRYANTDSLDSVIAR